VSACAPLTGNHGIDDPRERLNASLLGVPAMYKLAAGIDESLAKAGIVPQPDHRECERLRVIRLYKKSVLFVHEDLGNRSNTRGYDGRAGCESFERDAPKALVDASWVDDDIGGGEHVCDRVDEARKHDVLPYSQLTGDVVELISVREIYRSRMWYADDKAVRIGIRGQYVRE
jgi:hypothetical protein